MRLLRLLLLALLAPAAVAWSQVALLDNFNSPGATGAALAGTSWVGQVTRTATTVTVGGTARDDNGWGAIGLAINASSMTQLSVTAQRDAGHVAASLVVELQDAQLATHVVSIPATSFAIGSLTTVTVPLGAWSAGFNPAQVTGWTIGGGTPPTGITAFRMTFDHLSLTGGAPPVLPTLTQQPADRVIGIDTGTTFTVAATSSSGPLRYQWKKGGTAIAGATLATLSVASATLETAGLYEADITNDAGTTPSRAARLTVLDARPVHTLAPGSPGYVSAGTVSLANTLTYNGTAAQVRWSVMLPTGWTLASDTATTASTRPVAGTHSLLEWIWTNPPASPLTFTYTLDVPIGTEGDRTVTALVTLTQNGATGDIVVKRDPLTIVNLNDRHSADTNGDSLISLTELARVIELYNTRNGSARTGCYKIDPAGEDGFAPDPSRTSGSVATLSRHHSADTRGATTGSPRDGAISLVELTRVIELYNTRTGTVRTGRYRAQADTEDGFTPAP